METILSRSFGYVKLMGGLAACIVLATHLEQAPESEPEQEANGQAVAQPGPVGDMSRKYDPESDNGNESKN